MYSFPANPTCSSFGRRALLIHIADSIEGFNWSENLRARAQRSSVSAGTGNGASFLPLAGMRGRAKSVADQGGTAAAPAPPPPAPPPPAKAPDHFQERILKGDFYMD